MSSKPKHAVREGLISLINTAIDEKLKNSVRTTIPGYFLEFDPETQLATLQVGIQRLNINGETFTPPPIVRCPVCIYGGTGGIVEVEIVKGDEALIHFSMRCIDGWRTQGGVAPLTRIERFREADAFAVLAPRSQKKVITEYANDGIRVRSLDGTRYVWLKKDGTILIKSTESTFINNAEVTAEGNVITAGGTDLDQLKADFDDHVDAYNLHKHTDSQGGQTSAPL